MENSIYKTFKSILDESLDVCELHKYLIWWYQKCLNVIKTLWHNLLDIKGKID